MKKVALSIVTMVAMSSFGFAGGDFETVEPVLAAPIVEEVSPFYVGLGLSAVATRNASDSLGLFDDKITEDDTGDILFMAGYEFSQYIAVEGRYMTSVWGKDSLSSRDSWGVYVKPQYPTTEAFTLYALLGYGGLNTSGQGLLPLKVNDTGFQWGVGASYAWDTHFSIFMDYVNVANDMDNDILFGSSVAKVDSDAVSVGVTYHF